MEIRSATMDSLAPAGHLGRLIVISSGSSHLRDRRHHRLSQWFVYGQYQNAVVLRLIDRILVNLGPTNRSDNPSEGMRFYFDLFLAVRKTFEHRTN